MEARSAAMEMGDPDFCPNMLSRGYLSGGFF
jgi:hypothetical protein